MTEQHVVLHGVSMAADWPEKIAAAQAVVSYTCAGVSLARIKYGEDDPSWGAAPCHDCGVVKGQYHVPDCEYESCPFCGNTLAGGCTCAIAELQGGPAVRSETRSTFQRALNTFERISIRVILLGLAVAVLWFLFWLWREGLFGR